MVKKIFKIFWFTFLAIVVLVYTGLLLMQTPRVQTFVTQKVADIVSENLIDADIRLEKILIKPFNTLIIKNVSVVDKAPYRIDTSAITGKPVLEKFGVKGCAPIDTLFRAESIIARFSLKGLIGNSIKIKLASIINAEFNLVLEDGEASTNLTRMFRIKKAKERKNKQEQEIFRINSVNIDNIRFTMKDYTSKEAKSYGKGMDWGDLDARDIKIKGSNLKLIGKVMSGELDRLSFSEKSGYICHSLSGRTRTGNGQAIIEDLNLTDEWSDIHIDKYIMSYESGADFSEYVDKVHMTGEISMSRLSFNTLSYFIPAMEGNNLVLDINGNIYGTVNDLNISDIKFSSPNGNLSGNLNGRLADLVGTGKIYADAKLSNIRFTTRELNRLIGSFSSSNIGIGKYAPGKIFRLDGNIKGHVDNLGIKASIKSSTGNAETDLRLSNISSVGKQTEIRGTLTTSNLALNEIISGIPIRQCSLTTGITAKLPSKKSPARVSIDSLKISRLNFNHYDYKGIAATGVLADNQFDGKLICNDPNLNFLFQGVFPLAPKDGKDALYQFYANIGYANLYALNIDKRGRSEVQLRTIANFTRQNNGDLSGNVKIADIKLENSKGKYDIGDVLLSSYSGEKHYEINLGSEFAEAQYEGSASITSFFKDLGRITIAKELPALSKSKYAEWSGERYKLSFKTLNTIDLLSFLAPGVYIADNSAIYLSIDNNGEFDSSIKSQRIAFKEQYIKDLDFKLNNRDEIISGELFGGSMNLASFLMQNNRLKLFADNNRVGAGFSYENPGEKQNKGEIIAIGGISSNDDKERIFDIKLLPSSIYVNSELWSIYESEATIKGKEIDLTNFELRSGEQSISVSGGVSPELTDTLRLNMTNFDLSIFNLLTKQALDLKGYLTGLAMYTSPTSSKGILADFICDSTSIGGTALGNLKVSSIWDTAYNRFDIMLANELNGKATIDVRGNYTPSVQRLDMTARLDNFNIGYAKPFVKDIFSVMDGHISGKLMVEGPLDNLEITSRDTEIDDAYLKIAYTNVGYNVKGPFHIDNLGVYFDNISLADRHGNRGNVNGKIGYDHFKNINFDTKIDVNRIEAIDLTEKESDVFYGHLFATGDIAINGPVNSIMMTIDAATSRSGDIHIPIPSSLSAGSTDLLKFKEKEIYEAVDPYEEMMKRLKKEKSGSSDFGLKLKVSTNPEVEAYVEIDKESGNVLTGRGTGTIEMEIRPKAEVFDLKGDYTLNSGSYHFSMANIVARDFSINDGSSIRFNGDIMESTLNIDAVYRTKASLQTLIADTTSVNNRRTVECGIQITDKIRNPRLGFSINIPDIDPMVKARVESALSTEDKVQKQFLSLLISNSFLPDEQSGIANNSSMLYSNMTEIMANQLNSIFQKLDIPLDLGLSYQQNNRGNSIFDVAVSTQLFNNRVVVNGNFGNRQYRSGSSGSEFTGDIDIEIKLDRPGALRLNLFSHSADQYTNYLDNSQRNGVGIAYQQEFNRFGQFVRLLFANRKKKDEAELEAVRNAQNEEKVTLMIDADHNSEKSKAAGKAKKAVRKKRQK